MIVLRSGLEMAKIRLRTDKFRKFVPVSVQGLAYANEDRGNILIHCFVKKALSRVWFIYARYLWGVLCPKHL